jgi:hypothetical protein
MLLISVLALRIAGANVSSRHCLQFLPFQNEKPTPLPTQTWPNGGLVLRHLHCHVLCRAWDHFCSSRPFDGKESLMEWTRDSTSAVASARQIRLMFLSNGNFHVRASAGASTSGVEVDEPRGLLTLRDPQRAVHIVSDTLYVLAVPVGCATFIAHSDQGMK